MTVTAFWSVSVYNRDGYYEPNQLGTYIVNSVTAESNDSGEIIIQFGNCKESVANCLPVIEGWNYMVRRCRPDQSILDNEWHFLKVVQVAEGE